MTLAPLQESAPAPSLSLSIPSTKSTATEPVAAITKPGKGNSEQLAASFDKFSSALDSFVTAVNGLRDVKLQDGALTVSIDTSTLKKEIQAIVAASVGGKVPPPTIA
jgi:hypothetical protein